MLRRIKSSHDTEADKKRRRNNLIIGGFLIAILVFSTAGYAFFNNDDREDKTEHDYNGLKFINNQGFWVLDIEGELFYFQYLPDELDDVSISGTYDLSTFSGEPLYFVNNNAASQEILNNLGRYIERYQEACLESCGEDLPIKDCESNLIIFENGVTNSTQMTKVYKEANCTYIEGNFFKGVDAFLYDVFGIK